MTTGDAGAAVAALDTIEVRRGIIEAISEDQYVAGLEAAGLEEAHVVERLVYDIAQLEALIGSEIIEGAEGSSGCCGAAAETVDLTAAAAELEGEVWSAIFLARKPG